MFHVGQKVVCVDASEVEPDPTRWAPLRKDAVYTVRQLVVGLNTELVPTPGLILHEIKNPMGPYGKEYNYAVRRFRPLTDTSISDVLAKAAPRDSRKWDNRRKIREKV